MKRTRFHGVLVTLVVAALVIALLPHAVRAGASARLQGRVLDADGVTPLHGVVVNLLDGKNRVSFPSTPTDQRGMFEAEAPAGSYSIVAETARGAYLASGSVKLKDGRNAPLSLTLKQAGPEGQAPAGETPPGGTKTGKLAPWAKWTIVGGIVVAGLLVIDSVSSNESPASGF